MLQGTVCLLLSISLAQAVEVQSWDYLSQSALKWHSFDAKTIELAQKNKKLLMVLVYKDDCAWSLSCRHTAGAVLPLLGRCVA